MINKHQLDATRFTHNKVTDVTKETCFCDEKLINLSFLSHTVKQLILLPVHRPVCERMQVSLDGDRATRLRCTASVVTGAPATLLVAVSLARAKPTLPVPSCSQGESL